MSPTPILNPQEQNAIDAQRFDAPARAALGRALAGLGFPDEPTQLDKAAMEGFDYQSRGAFSLCKKLGVAPAEAAKALAAALDAQLTGIGSASASPGAGFVNIRLDDRFILEGAGLPLFPLLPELRALVDYSSPNCAKRMHVGHLRSTVIGDALCRIMEACGADVERVNHLGDWGTPFGVIIEQAKDDGLSLSGMGLESIEQVYQRGSARMSAGKAEESGPEREAGLAFAARARATTAKMQSRDPGALADWELIRASTLAELQKTYELLGIGLRPEHAIGESAYQDEAGAVLADLVARGLCESGPQGVAFMGSKTPLPMEKSAQAGGGLLYGGTDAAALKRRGATGRKLLYVTDERQAGHFEALFELGVQAGFIERGQASHIAFGMMLGKDGKPFKSRQGGTMPLSELVGDALDLARAAARAKAPEATPEEVEAIAVPVGVGALKYGDLSRTRISSVKFDLAQTIALEGDTAPYHQYARVRAFSAAAACEGLPERKRAGALHPRERAVALRLATMRDGACDALSLMAPHHLCQSMFEATSAFNGFYEDCPCVLGAERDPIRAGLMESFAMKMQACLASLGVASMDSMPRAKARPRLPS